MTTADAAATTERTPQVVFACVRNGGRSVIGRVLTFRDVTERQQLLERAGEHDGLDRSILVAEAPVTGLGCRWLGDLGCVGVVRGSCCWMAGASSKRTHWSPRPSLGPTNASTDG